MIILNRPVISETCTKVRIDLGESFQMNISLQKIGFDTAENELSKFWSACLPKTPPAEINSPGDVAPRLRQDHVLETLGREIDENLERRLRCKKTRCDMIFRNTNQVCT